MRLKSADTLRALMQQESVSIGNLAASAGCSKGFISHLLAGRRRSCTAALAAKIATSLGAPVTVLFEISKPIPADAIRILGPYHRSQRRH
ncbi:helix-turn-helix domain-containing protein [Psychromicrobium lacuslunae]|uniref:helix-turn-helix domain-containing protein n=1 Tax=Psychromicrobium lacuslunae TaxID=1618207 RepID=UPI0005D40E46